MLLLSLSLFAPEVAALDVETFTLSSGALDGQGGLQVESPTLGWPGAFYGGLGLVYARGQLVRVYGDGTEENLLSDTFATRLAAGYTIAGRARIGLDMPLYPAAFAGDEGGFALGDLRLRGVVGIPVGDDSPLSVAVIPSLIFPTGSTDRFLGTGGVGGGLAAAVGYQATDAIRVDANLGFRAVRASAILDQELGSAIELGLGGNYAVRPDVRVGLELDGAVDVEGGIGEWTDNPFEVHAYGQYGKSSGIQATLGLGTGLVGGVGAPEVRVIGAVGWRLAGEEPIYDTDEDGIYDDTDACVTDPEDKDNFEDTDGCPDRDNDRDGFLDRNDACPNEAEDADGWKDDDGCPEPDNDQDGIIDTADACPDVAGPLATNGCPDKDGDTVVDAEDACPDVPGVPELGGCPDRDKDRVPEPRDQCPDEPIDPREDPTRSDGCPRRVFVTAERIEILEKVFFDTNKTTIKKESYGLLADVAKVLNANPDIAVVEVSGHTDSVGNDKANLKLSQGRAESVAKHLETIGGVATGRLVAVGYGEARPIDTNATDSGRGANRRVEFVIKAVSGAKKPLGTPVQGAPPPGTPPAPAGGTKPVEPIPADKPAETPAKAGDAPW